MINNKNEIDAICRAVQYYVDGAISGKGDDMKPGFHEDATIYGYVGNDLFAGPIQGLYDWNDENGPAAELQAKITSIEIIETAANVRVDLSNWTGSNYSDLFNLLKVDGEWKIMNKVFHTYS